MNITTADDAFDYLTGNGIADVNEVQLVSDITGYTLETMENILYARTGYRTFSQAMGDED